MPTQTTTREPERLPGESIYDPETGALVFTKHGGDLFMWRFVHGRKVMVRLTVAFLLDVVTNARG